MPVLWPWQVPGATVPHDSASPYGRRKTVASVLAQLPSPAAELRGPDQGGFPERHTDSRWRAQAD